MYNPSAMATVYLVSDGSYSDYRVAGVYSTKEKADYAKRLFATVNEIEEYELDGLPEHPPGMLYFSVVMDEAGNVTQSYTSAPNYYKHKWAPFGSGKFILYQWAKDSAHAIKIANEKRIQLIASGLWPIDWEKWRKLTDAEQNEIKTGKITEYGSQTENQSGES